MPLEKQKPMCRVRGTVRIKWGLVVTAIFKILPPGRVPLRGRKNRNRCVATRKRGVVPTWTRSYKCVGWSRVAKPAPLWPRAVSKSSKKQCVAAVRRRLRKPYIPGSGRLPYPIGRPTPCFDREHPQANPYRAHSTATAFLPSFSSNFEIVQAS